MPTHKSADITRQHHRIQRSWRPEVWQLLLVLASDRLGMAKRQNLFCVFTRRTVVQSEWFHRHVIDIHSNMMWMIQDALDWGEDWRC